jgi:GntR family transcriptional repressor for pyruvate dehydrogenase complex
MPDHHATTGFAPLRREKLSESVAERLREQIRDGGLPVGARLPGHRELAAMFSVGLSSVREAISMLASEGLVETRAGRGTYVQEPGPAFAFAGNAARLTRREVEEVIEAREIVELQLGPMAAERAAPEDVARLRECLDAMAAAVDDVAAYADADMALHMAIADAAKNRFLRQAVEQIRSMIRENMELASTVAAGRPGGLQASLESHRRLVDSIESGDAEATRSTLFEMMGRHHESVLKGAAPAGTAPDTPAAASPAA